MSDYGRIGDYIGPVAAKKLSAVDIDANSSNQHEFGGNDALRRLLGTGEDRRASQGHGIPTALMYLSDDDAPRSPTSKPHGTTHGATTRTAAPNGVSTTRTASQSAWPAPATSCASVCSGTIVC